VKLPTDGASLAKRCRKLVYVTGRNASTIDRCARPAFAGVGLRVAHEVSIGKFYRLEPLARSGTAG
jgi:hypothetical protein